MKQNLKKIADVSGGYRRISPLHNHTPVWEGKCFELDLDKV